MRSNGACKTIKALPIFEALIGEAHIYAEKYNVPVSKINDQEMVSDMYMNGRFDIKLDHTNRIFQAMHATHAKPLVECDPWPETKNLQGSWENIKHNTKPKIFHFNGGGKIHHLEMEKGMWYRNDGDFVTSDGNRYHSKNKEDLREMELVVGDGAGERKRFSEICMGY